MKLTNTQNKAVYNTLKLISLITFVVMVFIALITSQCAYEGFYSYNNKEQKFEELDRVKSMTYSYAVEVANAYNYDYLNNPLDFTAPNYTYELYYNPVANLGNYDDFLPSSAASEATPTQYDTSSTTEPPARPESGEITTPGESADQPYTPPENLEKPVYPQLVLSTFDGESNNFTAEHQINNYLVKSYIKFPPVPGDMFEYSYNFYLQFYKIRMRLIYALVVLFLLQTTLVLVILRMAYKLHEPQTQWDDNKFPHINIPLEFYIALFAIAAFFALFVCFDNMYFYYNVDKVTTYIPLIIMGVAYLGCLELLVGFVKAMKKPKWWHHTIIYKVYSFFASIYNVLKEVFQNISVTWKFGLAFCTLTFLNLIFANYYFSYYSGFMFMLGFVLNCVVLVGVCYLGVMLNKLKVGAEHIAAGDVNYKIDTTRMYDVFKTHADNLNNIGNGISAAVAKEMKSERLKTELITNVSHDIKTPLTSIINYANLLDTQELNQQSKEYLEVVLRSSERLKKLTEDLVDASKASTKNMSVEYTTVNLPELINQSLGEYSEKFESKDLNIIFDEQEDTPSVCADGRHMWRILDNVFSNIYKYALEGTRVYIDLLETEENTMQIVVKNTSKDRLNIGESELIERFVRGDSSRSTEGSGLGLSIARSLCELMGGSFKIEIDGDLFKVTVILKKAEN